MFAADAFLSYSGKSYDQVLTMMQKDFDLVCRWYINNKLVLMTQVKLGLRIFCSVNNQPLYQMIVTQLFCHPTSTENYLVSVSWFRFASKFGME